MAGANLPSKKYKKTAPTQLRLSFEGTGGSTQFIDIAQALSIINKRFYRQGVYYYVNSVEFYNNADHYMDLHVCPDTWGVKNAWNRGFKIFQKMNALAPSGFRPKYHDFKIYMSARHATTGTMEPSMYDINAAATPFSADEWVYSRYTSMDDNHDGSPDADEFTAHMLGGHTEQDGTGSSTRMDSIGLLTSYQQSRARQPDAQPNLPSGATGDPLANLFDASSEEFINDLVENLEADNDETPYNNDLSVGQNGHMQHVARLATSTSLGRVATAPGFCAPFGLICVDPANTTAPTDEWRLTINLAPGTYHGVYAERA